jgi:hypothetical protein
MNSCHAEVLIQDIMFIELEPLEQLLNNFLASASTGCIDADADIVHNAGYCGDYILEH